jgi:tetratricopeptide (TPR) repeat protein
MVGDYPAAENALKQCLEAAQVRQHRYFIARSTGNLGLLSYYQESYQQAEDYLRQALAIWIDLGHEPYCAHTMVQLGHVFQAAGQDRYQTARQYYEQALQRSVEHRLAPFAMEIMTGLINLIENANKNPNVVDLLNYIKSHPASTYETKGKAQKLLNELDADFSLEFASENGHRSPTEWQAIAMEFMDGFDKPI